MPLTVSHPAVVLPLRRLGIPLSVMVIASMVPDLPLFARWDAAYAATHRPVGIVTIDLALTAVVVAVWFGLVRDALVDAAPDPVRSRLLPTARLDRAAVLLSPVAAVVGAASHVLWDSFTHPGRWGVRQIGWLEQQHGALSGAEWAQYASSVVGLLVVLLAAAAYLRGAAPDAVPRASRRLPRATLTVVAAATVVVGGLAAARSASAGLGPMAFGAVVDGLVTLAGGVLVVAVAWNVRRP